MLNGLSTQPIRVVAITIALFVGCRPTDRTKTMEQIRFEAIRSQIGNELLAPSDGTFDEEGATWYIHSPNNQAVISVFTYTAEGSGSLQDFGSLIAKWMLPENESDWLETAWSPISLTQGPAQKRSLTLSSGKSESRWRVY